MKLACCGMDCTACDAYKATINNDDKMKASVARQWTIMSGAPVEARHINCLGCRGGGAKTHFCEALCEIRRCCLNKEIEHCGLCDVFPCDKVSEVFLFSPDNRARLEGSG